MIGNLSVLYAHHIDGLKLDFAVRRSNSKKGPLGCVNVLKVVTGRRRQAASGFQRESLETPAASNCRSWYAGLSELFPAAVVSTNHREELFEDFELPLALNFLCVSAHTDFAASETAQCSKNLLLIREVNATSAITCSGFACRSSSFSAGEYPTFLSDPWSCSISFLGQC